MKLTRVVALLVVSASLAVAAAACNDDDKDSGDNTPAAATTPGGDGGAESVTVQVDGDGDGYDAYMLAYFPGEITLHAGDSVRFKLSDSGEPHTVTSGGPVTDVLDFIYDFCGPEGAKAAKCRDDTQIPPEVLTRFDELFGALPPLLPDGPGDANQTAANPCFLATGTLPDGVPCEKVDQPDFTGTETLYNSGWMGEEDDFVLTLAPDIAPGTYRFLCLLHGPEMVETINVVAASADADSAADVDARAAAELNTYTQELDAPAADLAAFAGEDIDGVHIDVHGEAGAESVTAGVAEFGPEEISIPVGGTVTWMINGFHTVSFNAAEDVKSLRTVAADGTVHLNETAASPAQTTPPEPPADESAPPPMFDGGTWNGEGFLSTGAYGGPFKLTFSEEGTYEYKCLIHDGMEGTVKVGG